MRDFTHLRVHSHYTLLGGTASVAELAQQAAADGMRCLTLCDTNVLYGAVAFDKACRAFGIQPILGMTVTVAAAEEGPLVPDRRASGQLVLLATGPDGYRSLCRLSSLIQGCPERQKRSAYGLDWQALKAHRLGLICLSGGRAGWIERSIRAGDLNAAHRCAGRLAGIYGENACLALSCTVKRTRKSRKKWWR